MRSKKLQSSNSSVCHLKTGVKIAVNVVSDLLSPSDIGNEMFIKFAEERI